MSRRNSKLLLGTCGFYADVDGLLLGAEDLMMCNKDDNHNRNRKRVRQWFSKRLHGVTALPGEDDLKEEDSAEEKHSYRLLNFDRPNWVIACRVHDSRTYNPMPSLSDCYTVECATRSLARLKNLVVTRSTKKEDSMLGPGDYYTNLEQPHKNLWTVDLDSETFPVWKKWPLPQINYSLVSDKPQVPQEYIHSVSARWISGKQAKHDRQQRDILKKYYKSVLPTDASLFPDPGILEIFCSDRVIHLPTFDATKFDLSSFKATLSRNDEPFKITQKGPTDKFHSSDEYRPVSYDFGNNYATNVMESTAGLFLEHHKFAQTMTPLDAYAKGFIVLGRWAAARLELIAVQIPFGYTLVVQEGCIHGDTTLQGMYMMAMTSNHHTMNSADAVFLKRPNYKYRDDKETMTYDGSPEPQEICEAISSNIHIKRDTDDNVVVEDANAKRAPAIVAYPTNASASQKREYAKQYRAAQEAGGNKFTIMKPFRNTTGVSAFLARHLY